MGIICLQIPFFSFLSPSSNRPGRCMTTPLPRRAEEEEYVKLHEYSSLNAAEYLSSLPMREVLLELMIPLGRRWKSYSLPSTTTVCPALLPPCKSKHGARLWRGSKRCRVFSAKWSKAATRLIIFLWDLVGGGRSHPLPDSLSFSSTCFSKTWLVPLDPPLCQASLSPGLLTYQASLRMWPLCAARRVGLSGLRDTGCQRRAETTQQLLAGFSRWSDLWYMSYVSE